MMSYLASAFLTSSMLFSLVSIPAPAKAVTVTGALQPDAAQTDHFTVTIQMDIKNGWHTYAEVGDGSEVRTSLELKLPEGVKATGDWKRPIGKPGTASHSEYHVGKVSFSKKVVIEPSAYGKSIDVMISYQACTDEFCNRPQRKTVSIAIPADRLAGPSLFARPVRLNVDGAPLNTVAKKKFPSPAIFDVDGDGQTELVIGGLMGSVGVYENQNTSGTGDPVWGAREPFKDAEGNTIRTSNW